jgi:hypothetical protein
MQSSRGQIDDPRLMWEQTRGPDWIWRQVSEAVIAHVRPGIKGAYDKHRYLEEKREALTLWNALLRLIVEPPAANIVELRA